MDKKVYDMLIIGGGPGGYTAALYAARAGLSVAVLEKLAPGGQMAETPWIDNYPGFPDGIDGFALGQQMKESAQRFGAETVFTEVTGLSLEGDVKSAQTADGLFYGRTVVIATGAGPRQLNVPGEQALFGRGVHYCAACDGMFYRNKTVVVVGGGNTAVADALLLSRVAKKVYLVHRRDQLRASKVYHRTLEQTENIEFIRSAQVTEIQPGKVLLKDLQTSDAREIAADGVFVAIGRTPASWLVKGLLALDEQGYILADESTATSLPGVYAVGDVRAKQLRQIVTAVADGAASVHQAEEYLTGIAG